MKVRDMPQMVIRLNPESKEWVKSKAAQLERSQNWIVAKAVEEARLRDEKQAA